MKSSQCRTVEESANGSICEGPIVLSFGELVVDQVGGQDRPGGAPLNFASALCPLLRAISGDCLVASRVGQDADGELLRAAMRGHGISEALLQSTSDCSTGLSRAEISPDGEVSFRLSPGAWDHIAFTGELQNRAKLCSGLLAGSLPLRSPESAATMLKVFAEASSAIRMFDINLRHEPEANVLTSVIESATHVKGTADEWNRVSGILSEKSDRPYDVATHLRERFNLVSCLVTNGPGGCVLIDHEGAIGGLPVGFPLEEGADPIGAGDHAAAGWMFAMLKQRSRIDQVAAADILGAWAASKRASAPGVPPAVRDLLV